MNTRPEGPSWAAYPTPSELPPAVRHDPTLPLVSIVTPSYNQGRFIRETIESVLTQDYPNIEHWVIDGGSSDETIAILREYEHDPRFHWISEPDHGQADAINKGWSRCQGDILCWLNSDDYYANDQAVRTQVAALTVNPACGLVYGDSYYVDLTGNEMSPFPTRDYSYRDLLRMNYIAQPTVFLRRDIVRRIGPLDISFSFAMDRDYWLRCTVITSLHYTSATIATYRLHSDSKTVSSSLALNIDGFGATCKHFSQRQTGSVTRREQRSIVASTLLTLAVRAIHDGELDFACRLTRGARVLNLCDARYVSVALAFLDHSTGWKLQPRVAGLAFFLLNPRFKYRDQPLVAHQSGSN